MINQMTLAEALIGLQRIKDKIELHEMAQELKFWQKRVKELEVTDDRI